MMVKTEVLGPRCGPEAHGRGIWEENLNVSSASTLVKESRLGNILFQSQILKAQEVSKGSILPVSTWLTSAIQRLARSCRGFLSGLAQRNPWLVTQATGLTSIGRYCP